jgi:hypothetical protein
MPSAFSEARHDWQRPSQRVSQQIPSMQKPLAHSSSSVHA